MLLAASTGTMNEQQSIMLATLGMLIQSDNQDAAEAAVPLEPVSVKATQMNKG